MIVQKTYLRRGFMLTELLYTLMILGVFSILADRLFVSTFGVTSKAAEQTEVSTKCGAAINQLRTDVAASESCEIANEESLNCNTSVSWTIEKTDLVRRSGGAEQRWYIGKTAKFRREGKLVLLQTSEDPASDIAMAIGHDLPTGGAK